MTRVLVKLPSAPAPKPRPIPARKEVGAFGISPPRQDYPVRMQPSGSTTLSTRPHWLGRQGHTLIVLVAKLYI